MSILQVERFGKDYLPEKLRTVSISFVDKATALAHLKSQYTSVVPTKLRYKNRIIYYCSSELRSEYFVV